MVTIAANTDKRMIQTPLEISVSSSELVPPLPNQSAAPPPPPPVRKSFAPQLSSISTQSSASSMIENPGHSTNETASEANGEEQGSVLTKTQDSSRYSQGSESFYTAAPSHASVDTARSPTQAGIGGFSGIDGSIRRSLYSHRRSPSNARHTPPLSSNSSHLDHEGGEEGEEVEVPNSPHFSLGEPADSPLSSTGDHSDDAPFTSHTAGTPVHESPPPSVESYPPSSFVFPSRTHSPIVRPPTTASSATTAPPYSPGPYHPYRGLRRDTLASNQTYETLPSYHSRRSTQTLADMVLPTTTHNFRSLPPLPPLPPFVSLSSILLAPSFASSPSSSVPNTPDISNIPASPEREGTTQRESERPDQ
ncbi:hypothetical protein PQX77_001238 [Marasmius sp. AFHP31]|nr:hypothetical protein PQX77_001238 [Marasmius sp. AFHP31]